MFCCSFCYCFSVFVFCDNPLHLLNVNIISIDVDKPVLLSKYIFKSDVCIVMFNINKDRLYIHTSLYKIRLPNLNHFIVDAIHWNIWTCSSFVHNVRYSTLKLIWFKNLDWIVLLLLSLFIDSFHWKVYFIVWDHQFGFLYLVLQIS